MSPTDRRLTLQPQMVSPNRSTSEHDTVCGRPSSYSQKIPTCTRRLPSRSSSPSISKSMFMTAIPNSSTPSLPTKGIPISVIGIYFVSHIYNRLNIKTNSQDLAEVLDAVNNDKTKFFVVLIRLLRSWLLCMIFNSHRITKMIANPVRIKFRSI